MPRKSSDYGCTYTRMGHLPGNLTDRRRGPKVMGLFLRFSDLGFSIEASEKESEKGQQ
jgi:hypothetical protein